MLAVPAEAGDVRGWRVGECFATADVSNDLVDLDSAIACAKPHAVQVIGGAALPPGLAARTYAQLRDRDDARLRAQLAAFSEETCSGQRTAAGIWPKQGAAIARVLTGLAATTGGGVLPALPESFNYGWAFPDEQSFAAGNRSMLCVIYPLPAADERATLTGNAQWLGSRRTLATMRVCAAFDAATESHAQVSCAEPHQDEQVAYFAGRLPVAYADMTDAQWHPFDMQCDAIVDALVGADRTDLRAYGDALPTSAANALVYIPCYVSRTRLADGTKPNLPPGTVVGLGTRPLV